MGVFCAVLIDQATHFSCVLQKFIYAKGFFFHKFERILHVPTMLIGRSEEKRREAIDTCLMLRITPSAADAS